MTLREAVLDALADDGESIVQISEYLQHLAISATKEEITELLNTLFSEKKIYVAFPRNLNIQSISSELIDYLWFELTDAGKSEWEQIE